MTCDDSHLPGEAKAFIIESVLVESVGVVVGVWRSGS